MLLLGIFTTEDSEVSLFLKRTKLIKFSVDILAVSMKCYIT